MGSWNQFLRLVHTGVALIVRVVFRLFPTSWSKSTREEMWRLKTNWYGQCFLGPQNWSKIRNLLCGKAQNTGGLVRMFPGVFRWAF